MKKSQVLIIGSGAGGAITALRLAEAGFDVTVLEDGHAVPEQKPLAALATTDLMELYYRNRGMTPILGPVPIGFVQGRLLGGSTEINSGFWHRLPPEFLLRWRSRFGLDAAGFDEMEQYYAYLEDILKVASLPPEQWPPSTRIMQDGIQAMGWSHQQVPRCASSTQRAGSLPGNPGQGMSATIIPRARDLGVKFVTGARARMILRDGRRAVGVLAEMLDLQDRATHLERWSAEHVFVCAGPTQTPALLRRSMIRRHVGDTFHIHPMLKISALFNEHLDADKTVLPLLQIKEFWPDVSMGGAFFSPGHLALNLGDNFDANAHLMRRYRDMATYYVAVRGTGAGTVRSSLLDDGEPRLRYRLSAHDVHNLSQGMARMSMLLLEAGAISVHPCVSGLPVIDSKLTAARYLDQDLRPASISLTTVHAFSACPIGNNRSMCAADSFGKIWDLDNLYVNDASILPDSPGINPQGTIMALAMRNTERFIENRGKDKTVPRITVPEFARPVLSPPASTCAIVTGAPGWLGNRLIRALALGLDPDLCGPDLMALNDRLPRPIKTLTLAGANVGELKSYAESIEPVLGDLRTGEGLDSLFADSRGATVFHIAGVVHPGSFFGASDFDAINAKGTEKLVQAALTAGVKRLIYISSNSPLGVNKSRAATDFFDDFSSYNPYMGYGRSKQKAELAIKAAADRGLEVVILRPPWFYGPGQPPRQSLFFSLIRQGKAPIVGDGLNLRSMAYVDNICQAMLLAERVDSAAGQTFWISDRRPYTMVEIVDTIEDLLESDFGLACKHGRMHLPNLASEVAMAMDAGLQALGMYHQKVHVLSEMNKTIAGTIIGAERGLGYRPQVELKEGMRRSIAWVLERGGKI